jgi:hypothetical protein
MTAPSDDPEDVLHARLAAHRVFVQSAVTALRHLLDTLQVGKPAEVLRALDASVEPLIALQKASPGLRGHLVPAAAAAETKPMATPPPKVTRGMQRAYGSRAAELVAYRHGYDDAEAGRHLGRVIDSSAEYTDLKLRQQYRWGHGLKDE